MRLPQQLALIPDVLVASRLQLSLYVNETTELCIVCRRGGGFLGATETPTVWFHISDT